MPITTPTITRTYPNWLTLMELWLQTHHAGQPAVIFSSPLRNPDVGFATRVEAMKKLFGQDFEHLIGAEFAVFVCPTHEEAVRIMREVPENNPHALTWNGAEIIRERGTLGITDHEEERT